MRFLLLLAVWFGMSICPVRATSLVLDDVPTATEARQSFEVWVQFLTTSKNASYYLSGVFYKTSGSDLFGLTEVGGNFIPVSASPSCFYQITTSDEGSWSGKIRVKADIADPGFKGEGDYLLRIDRYTGKSANPAESSNEKVIKLNYVSPSTPTPLPTESPTPRPTNGPTPITVTVYVTPVPTPAATAVKTKPKVKTASAAAILGIVDAQASLAAETASDSSVSGNNLKPAPAPGPDITPWLILIGCVFLAAGLIPLSLKLFPTVE